MKKELSQTDRLIAEAYVEYRDHLCRFIRFRIEDVDEAEDLTQDVFLRLLDYRQLICPATIRSFVFTIARNLVNDHLRRYYKWQEISLYMMEQHSEACTHTESRILADDLAACEQRRVLQLPRQRGIVYQMSRYEGKTIPEIALSLNLSERTVENHLFISRREVREYIRQCI